MKNKLNTFNETKMPVCCSMSLIEERYFEIIISNQMRIALDKIANSPTPYNERELKSWYETARDISLKALSGQTVDECRTA